MIKNNQKILAIIPARGGSKGIPRKNIRLLAGKPLIAYSIETALKSKYIDRVVVSTEDEEICEIARLYGVDVIRRPVELSGDETPLDPVIHHAVTELEKKGDRYDIIITLQPTSPLLSVNSIDNAIQKMIEEDYDTILSVVEDRHLYWIKEKDEFRPLFKERKNRQFLIPLYRESGGFLISRREVVKRNNRIGKKTLLFKVSPEEGIDIDSFFEWWIAENLLRRLKILFRVDGDYEIGLGHVYRAITLANRFSSNHEIFFLMDKRKKLGINKVEEYGYKIHFFENYEELFEQIKKIRPHIVINDILDTSKDYIQKLKDMGCFVVNFEDLGEGAEIAHLVINALYENSHPPDNHYYGYKYVCLRDEFHIFPIKKVKKNVEKILITFGGTDPNNLTLKTLKAIEKLSLKEVEINIVVGLGYKYIDSLIAYVNRLREEGYKISIKKNIKMMAKEIREADIAITSNGRTVYEIASMGTPCISIAQNERESRHLFVHNSKCIKYLGIAYNVAEDKIATAIKELLPYEIRKKMQKRCLKFKIKEGVYRVERLILKKYYEWAEGESYGE